MERGVRQGAYGVRYRANRVRTGFWRHVSEGKRRSRSQVFQASIRNTRIEEVSVRVFFGAPSGKTH